MQNYKPKLLERAENEEEFSHGSVPGFFTEVDSFVLTPKSWHETFICEWSEREFLIFLEILDEHGRNEEIIL